MHRGYIKLWRCIEENKLWQEKPFDRARAWIDLIRKARHEEGCVWIRGIEIPLKVGQLAWSEVSLAENWGWSRGKVRRFLIMLKTKQQIEQENTNVTSLITIKNYDLYNPKDQQTEHQVVQQTDSKRYTKKNEKNEKNKKNNITDEKSSATDNVEFAFSEYLRMSGRKKVLLNKTRRSKLSARLNEFSMQEIQWAWSRMAANKFLRGENDNNRDYFTIEYATRTDKIEEHLHKYYISHPEHVK